MEDKNSMCVKFKSLSVNESFARMTIAAFLSQLNPTLDELADIKTAVSEAVTNAIIHGYDDTLGVVTMGCSYNKSEIEIIVEDNGNGILDIEKARAPFFTTKPELERSGMGFAFMEAFMDEVQVTSAPDMGTKVVMRKSLGRKDDC